MNIPLPPTTWLPYDPTYPDSDGKPMAENTVQLRWITVLYGNLAALFRAAANVFVAADLFWYPVRGHSEIKTAPDVLWVRGRPKGDRRSWRQWLEANIPLQVVFEILSPGNSDAEMRGKFDFYERYGVLEYYLYDPDADLLKVWRRVRGRLRAVRKTDGWVSPLLGIRFDLSGPEMVVYRPDGQPFLTFEELQAQMEQERAEKEQERAEKEQERAEKEQERAEKEQERYAKERAERRVRELEQRLRELGVDPEA